MSRSFLIPAALLIAGFTLLLGGIYLARRLGRGGAS